MLDPPHDRLPPASLAVLKCMGEQPQLGSLEGELWQKIYQFSPLTSALQSQGPKAPSS